MLSHPCFPHPALIRAASTDSPQSTPASSAGVVLRRPSKNSVSCAPQRTSAGNLSPTTPSTPGGLSSSVFEVQHHGSPVPLSPHRVSWIEDGVWLPPPRPSSLLHPPSLELDTLSISSIEEEQESPLPSPTPNPHYPSAQRLAGKVIHRLSAVGQALGGLVCQKKKLTNRVQELSSRKGEPFTEAVKGFVDMILKRGADHGRGLEFLQEVRSSLTSLRETLLDFQEIQTLLDSMTDISDSEIGQ